MSPAFDPTTVVRKSDKQVSCVLNDEVALLNTDRALYFGLKGVGAHIWDRLDKPRTVAELCQDVVTHFDVEPEICRNDVTRFLNSLQEAGLIEAVG
jgi:hypothetical protein